MADLFRPRAFQGLLLLLLAAIALQVGGAVRGADGAYTADTQGAVFRADTPEVALLPLRIDTATVEAPDTGPSLTDDPLRAGIVSSLLDICAVFALPLYAAAPAHLEGGHRRLSLPRAPPLS